MVQILAKANRVLKDLLVFVEGESSIDQSSLELLTVQVAILSVEASYAGGRGRQVRQE
jgi:hypothetical protein